MTKSKLIYLCACILVFATFGHPQQTAPDEEKIEACMTRYFGPALAIEATPDGQDAQIVRCTKPSERLCDISVSLEGKNYDGVSCLIDAGFDFNTGLARDGHSFLAIAALYDPLMLKLLLEKTQVNLEARDAQGETVLLTISPQSYSPLMHYRRGLWDILASSTELLLAKGANPNVVDSQGLTPLMYHSRTGKTESVELLLKHKADPNTQTPDGESALMTAVGERVRPLLDAGADIYLKDKQGKTAIFYAVEKCDSVKAKLLIAKDPGVLKAVDNQGQDIRHYLKRGDECRELRNYVSERLNEDLPR